MLDIVCLRAIASILLNFFVYFTKRTYFFYFIPSLLQNTHISLSILHIYLIKYSFFLHFLLFHSLSSLAQTHHLVFSVHTHTQPASLPQNPATDSPIFHNNKIRPLIHRSSTTSTIKKNQLTQSETQSIPNPFITHQT